MPPRRLLQMSMRHIPDYCILLFFVWGILACTHHTPEPATAATFTRKSYKPPDTSMLQDGDIVLRSGRDVISQLFAALNTRDATYSHCGIAFREAGQWVVYHSIGGEDNPDEVMRRDSLTHFVSPRINSGYGICRYPLNRLQQERLHNVVDSFYRKKIPFDMKFDLHTDDRLYCAEMVYKAYQRALDTEQFFQTTVHQGFRYVATDNLFVNNNARIVCHIIY